MKLSNGHGLTYEIETHQKRETDDGVLHSFKLTDPHTGKSFWLKDMDKERLQWLGYKVVK